MLTLIRKFPFAFLIVMLLALAIGVWQINQLAGFGQLGYMIGFAIALGFFLVYWVSYGRHASTAFKAILPLIAIALLAAPFHLIGAGGIVASMLFYVLLPGSGLLLAVWSLSGKPLGV
jgi:hypothetical protein